jgi:hypothetical protein
VRNYGFFLDIVRYDAPSSLGGIPPLRNPNTQVAFPTDPELLTPYNRVLWERTMGDRPYPSARSGRDLRHNRKKLLAPGP